MYKQIIKFVVAIISQPGNAWQILTKKEEKDDEFLSRFVYPLIGFVTVAAFLGVLFTRKEFDVELALKSSIRTLVAAFGGYETIMNAYKIAKEEGYRFGTYGDAMLIL